MEAGALTVRKEESPENSDELTFYDSKATSTSSPKRSGGRRGTQKRVVQLLVPITTSNKEVVEAAGSRNNKVETTTINNTPPSDSWAWRKYGQKPIKGSPYPRGYYRCSSSKGCPARKQVERSRTDPTMVIVTYSCEHNHPWPAASSASSRNNHHHHPPTSPPAPTEPTASNTDDHQLEEEEEEEPPLIIQTTTAQTSTELAAPHDQQHDEDQKFTSSLEVGGSFVDQIIQYGWFSELDSCTSSISTTCMLESPLMELEAESDMTTIFSIREDEESFFADLGELPECTTVFGRRGIERVEDHRRNLAPALCTAGTTG